jgi:heptosyltransferase-1
MKIALIKLTSLGDIIHAAASLQLIRRNLPDCSITWVVDRRFADILDHQPDIQNIVKIDLKGLKKQRPLLAAISAEYRRLAILGPFDIIVDLQGMIKSAVIAAIMGGEKYGVSRCMRKEALAGLFYNHTVKAQLTDSSAYRHAALIANSLGLDFQTTDIISHKPYLFWGDEDGVITGEYFSQGKRNIIFVPGSSAAHKNYPPDRFAQLANLLRENILVCYGSPQELTSATRIAELSPYVRILPRLTLNQLKAAIGRADLVIGGDTGPIHIAVACGVPSITLFGATRVCICPTERNRAITAGVSVNLHKTTTINDLISRIEPEEIARTARELIQLS